MIEHIPGAHLIQETKDPLNKKFQCKHCGNFFRTRQGLSGHIQFKHGTKNNAVLIAGEDITEIKAKLEAVWGILELSESTTQRIKTILNNWITVVLICDSIGIDLNKQDFKNYFIARLVDIYQG